MMRKEIITAFILIIATVCLLTTRREAEKSPFEQWKTKFGVKYSSTYEDLYREKTFMQKLQKINLHNSDPERTYEMGLNQFSALTTEEFVNQFLLLRATAQQITVIERQNSLFQGDVDWEKAGMVARVKNQGSCGAVWAFVAIAGTESLYAISTGSLTALSQQQVLDCTANTQGCNGGFLNTGYDFIRSHGVLPEDQYPYVGYKKACQNSTGPFKITGMTDVKGCDNLANALTGRPISVAVDATNWSPYKSGVFSNCRESLNHGVLLTGMTDRYWRVKNSWGTAWGESGYMRIARGNTCGICNAANYPTR